MIKEKADKDSSQSGASSEETSKGKVSLVGAGPGDPDLLTRRAWKRLRTADVVLYDSLTTNDLIDEIPENTEKVDVGKRQPDPMTQEQINELMKNKAEKGEHVVRLKSGDPTVFGRGGEETEHLAEHEIEFETVAGISSVLAAATESGIPLTHRDYSSNLMIVTGHQASEKRGSTVDWEAVADTVIAGGTVIILMGVAKLPEIVQALQDYGVSKETPAGMVEKATWDSEQVITGTLETIVSKRDKQNIEPPAVTIVGSVVNIRDSVSDYLIK